MTSTRKGPALDWGWDISPATGAMMAAGGAYSLAAAGGLAGLPPGYALLAAGAGALAQGGADLYQRRPLAHGIARCTAWLTAGGWTAVALSGHNALTWGAAGWWGAGTAAAVVLARGLATAEERGKSERVQRKLQKWANGKAGEWHARLANLFRLEGHKVDGVLPWKGDVGYTVRVQMPEDTPELPSDADRKLAAALRLPRGGGVQIVDGMVYGEIQIRVTAKDVMAEDLPFPLDTAPATINDPIVLGLHPDATDAEMRLLDACALLVGQVGSGKSNTLNVANGAILKTDDCVVWHIDTTGAGISLPWLRSWAVTGESRVPVIDWTADTVEEAHIMLDVAIAGIGARKAGYQDLMASVDDDKIPVSPQVPAILIVVDEIAELPQPIMDKLDSVVNTGRAARIRTFKCGLRATQDVITAAMKKQSRNRAGMRVSDPEELHHLFPSGRGHLDPKAAPHKGCGFLASPDEDDLDTDPAPFKAYRITPKDIDHLSPRLADRRPAPDPVFLDTEPGRFYASRWGRVLPRLYKAKKLAATTTPYTDLDVLYPLIDKATGLPITGGTDSTTSSPAPATPAGGTGGSADRGIVTDANGRFGADALA
ncbi:S-DNA-T family DNA segregation ATPase FtsK/SpoIIIE, partial [Streptomyces netropsis]